MKKESRKEGKLDGKKEVNGDFGRLSDMDVEGNQRVLLHVKNALQQSAYDIETIGGTDSRVLNLVAELY